MTRMFTGLITDIGTVTRVVPRGAGEMAVAADGRAERDVDVESAAPFAGRVQAGGHRIGLNIRSMRGRIRTLSHDQ